MAPWKTKVLKTAERNFLRKYPGGFANEHFSEMEKKYKIGAHTKFARDAFAKSKFNDPKQILDDATKLVSRSSMVSVFEKPKFRDMIKGLGSTERKRMSGALYELVHGKQKSGFEAWVDELAQFKLAKWTLATAVPAYYRVNKEVFIKPTTVKMIIETLGLDLHYHARPRWDFYRDYRKFLGEAKSEVDPGLSPNNPAFSGFMMMTLPELAES